MGARILIVEDEVDLAQSLAYSLEKEGFVVTTAHRGGDALEAAKKDTPDLVLLDLMLPDTSGLDVCRELRNWESTRQVPIIMATARGEEIDRVVGFEVGADDYVVKPYSVRELVLRIKAVLRRRTPLDQQPNQATEFGRLRVDIDAHQVFVDGEERTLTALEFKTARHPARTSWTSANP
jgi:two-component system phosphate regulon response regulator PhoB